MGQVNEFRNMLLIGKEKGATHVIIVEDQFDLKQSAIYVMPGEDPHEVEGKYTEETMNKNEVMGVYNMGMDIDQQIASGRAWNYEIPGQEKPKCPFDMTPLINVGVLKDYGDEKDNHICPLCKRVWLDIDKEEWHSRTARVQIVGALKDVGKDGIKYTDVVKVVE